MVRLIQTGRGQVEYTLIGHTAIRCGCKRWPTRAGVTSETTIGCARLLLKALGPVRGGLAGRSMFTR